MVQITMVYEGDLHCRAVHEPSSTVLETDAPQDNMGKGERFSPTDLVATALGTCMLTIMGMLARSMQVDMRGATAKVRKEMVAAPMRRIGSLAVHIHIPVELSDEQKQKFEKAAHACPVHRSLHPDITIELVFSWG